MKPPSVDHRVSDRAGVAPFRVSYPAEDASSLERELGQVAGFLENPVRMLV
jgi:hypothetical protein